MIANSDVTGGENSTDSGMRSINSIVCIIQGTRFHGIYTRLFEIQYDFSNTTKVQSCSKESFDNDSHIETVQSF